MPLEIAGQSAHTDAPDAQEVDRSDLFISHEGLVWFPLA